MTVALLVAGGVAAVVGLIVLVRAMEKRRREGLEQYCLVRGLRFEPERPGHETRVKHLHSMFDQGHGRRWGYTLTGDRPSPFTAFEYLWTTGSGKHQHTHHIVGLLWEVPESSLPQFRLEPESVFAKIGQMFGMQDFDFPEDPEFSSEYKLQGGDEAQVRGLFTAKRRAFFRGQKDRLAGAGSLLLWWRAGGFPKAEELDQFLSDAQGVRKAMLE
jgi:hypothetical protein